MDKHTEYIERLERIEKMLDEVIRNQHPIIIDNNPKWTFPKTLPMELPEPKYPSPNYTWCSNRTGNKPL